MALESGPSRVASAWNCWDLRGADIWDTPEGSTERGGRWGEGGAGRARRERGIRGCEDGGASGGWDWDCGVGQWGAGVQAPAS